MPTLSNLSNDRANFSLELLIKITLIVLLSTAAGISYLFMLYFNNKAECERLEPNHVVCQQYKTYFDLAKSMLWHGFVKDSLISYRLIGATRLGNKIHLETDKQRILYLYEPTKYNEKLTYRHLQLENFIWGMGDSKLVLSLDNSRDREQLLYFIWALPTFFLFINSLPTNKK